MGSVGLPGLTIVPAVRSSRGEPFGGTHQLKGDGLVGRVPRAVHDDEFRLRPYATQLQRIPDGRLVVVASVHHHPGNVGERGRSSQEGAILDLGIVTHVVGDEASECHRIVGVLEPW